MQRMAKRVAKRAVSAVVSAIVVGAALSLAGAGAAQAAPVCNVPDAPPACSPGKPKPPAPPADLESTPFSPIAGETNAVYFVLGPVPRSVVDPYGPRSDTPFRVALSCSNGYFSTTTLHKSGADLLANHIEIPPDAAAGTCYAATWDQVTLKLSRVTVAREFRDSTAFEIWDVTFTP